MAVSARGKKSVQDKATSSRPEKSAWTEDPVVGSKKHAADVVRGLRRAYPDAECSLDHRSPLELLVSTILSAQCTDARVNLVTKQLFSTCRAAADYATMPLADLERAIQSTGFYRNKAKNIRNFCGMLVEQFGGKVPQDLDTLVKLPGVGRKTANVILGTAFGIASGIVVDTHVKRLGMRLGLTRHKDPAKIEKDLVAVVPPKEWIALAHRMIQHGRRVCVARKPKCDGCPLEKICPKIGVKSTQEL